MPRRARWWQVAILVPWAIVVAPLIAAGWLVPGVLLHVAIWIWWCPRGRAVLFVYSNSPVWHEHVTTEILPMLDRRAVILNWSARSRWRPSLATMAF